MCNREVHDKRPYVATAHRSGDLPFSQAEDFVTE